ncbi:MAG: phosphoribosylformylglycinamidine synthase subunit PurL, partial [Nitratireductor sp.]
MNALRFGEPNHPKTKHLVSGVVAGVGGYGNSFGVPTVGGEVEFHERYNGNNLVNAFAAGIAKTDRIFLSEAKGVGLPVVYLGAKTGRDGVGGATMASAEFDDSIEEKRPTVQVGDPFTEKCLLEACLELMDTGAVIAIQDMGAAGLTCSAVEMGAKGGLGFELYLDDVPCREENMSAYEMMLSESQERMLMVLDPKMEAQSKAIFTKWGLDFAIVGKTTDDKIFRVIHQGETVASLPIMKLGDEAPEYDRPWVEPVKPAELAAKDIAEPKDYNEAILTLIGSPDLSSRRWVYEQYDTYIQGNSLLRPGGDAGVVRVEGTNKALSFSSDVTPRFCEADPFEGGKQAVAECYRNLTAVGSKPLASTDNLNFGNPEKPEIMGQFVFAIKGIGEACKALDMPIVSGNVSLYNETFGTGILPTPTIGGVGILKDQNKFVSIDGFDNGDALYLVGEEATHLGQSIYLREILGKEEGGVPFVDLAKEKSHGDFIRASIDEERLSACHDISDGGLAIALAEMAMAADKGMHIEHETALAHAALFGEDQARYIVALNPKNAEAFEQAAKDANVPLSKLGHVEGDALKINDLINISVKQLRDTHESWFPDFMNGETAQAAE